MIRRAWRLFWRCCARCARRTSRAPPLEIVFTIAEEVGLMGSTVLDYSLLSAPYGFVPDGSGDVGLIINRAPAQKHLHVVIHGRAAHAGMAPEEGINAITVAAHAIADMRQGRIDAETTANIGVIHGGKATNIVPDTRDAGRRSAQPRPAQAGRANRPYARVFRTRRRSKPAPPRRSK